jgi:hypothetical protein
MGYGGVVNKITDPFGIGDTTPKTPSPRRVGQDYLALIDAWAKGVPTTLDTERQYKPSFTELDLSELERVVPTFTNILKTLGPQAAGLVREANPGASRLLDTLTQQAQEGLDAGANLDPGLSRVLTQSVRGGQAARGMGFSPADVLQESTALTGLADSLRRYRQGFASEVTNLNSQQETMPALNLLTEIPTFSEAVSRGSGSTLLPKEQSYDVFNTAYNARAAANIQKANNDSSY